MRTRPAASLRNPATIVRSCSSPRQSRNTAVERVVAARLNGRSRRGWKISPGKTRRRSGGSSWQISCNRACCNFEIWNGSREHVTAPRPLAPPIVTHNIPRRLLIAQRMARSGRARMPFLEGAYHDSAPARRVIRNIHYMKRLLCYDLNSPSQVPSSHRGSFPSAFLSTMSGLHEEKLVAGR